jgi:ABC-type multidrug transport system permease subunit
LFGIVRLWCQPPGSAAWQWATLASLATAGTALGLLISAFARTEEVAVAFVPIAVIPQIILGGVIAPLSGLAKIVAKSAITVHWAEQALEALLPASQGESQYGGPLTVVWAHACAFLMATFLILWSPGIAKGQR